MVQVYLTRRNLLTLLNKLDQAKLGIDTARTITKCDIVHPKYPQSHRYIFVTALEDEAYYTDREPGVMREDIAEEERV